MSIDTKMCCTLSFSIALFAILSGCGLEKRFDDLDPQMSDLVLSSDTIPEVNRIAVPLPPYEAPSSPQRAETASLWKASARSLFLDQRAERVGDILTILIDIDDKAQLKNTSERTRTGSNETNNPSFFGYGSQIDKLLPGVAQSDLPTGGKIVDLGSTSKDSGEGSIKRNESIQLKVAAMVIQRLANGYFVIAGRQEVKVNNELRELRVVGVIRPQDITTNNSISYEKIAEARITYGGRGQISAVQRPKYGAEMLDIILPY
jgi:flagellar L-ring protein precursor FlgH